MPIYRTDKTVFRFRGAAADFLKAYTTQVPEAPRSAFLDVRGRIVVVCDQKLLHPQEALVVIERRFQDRFLKHVEKYLAFANVAVEGTPHLVFFDLDGGFAPRPSDIRIPQKSGQLILTERGISPLVSEKAFTLFRVRHGLPLQGVDFDDEILLNVFDDEDHVSYTKGCYLGQEIIARIHHRSSPAKKLVVKTEKECTTDEFSRMTSKIEDPDTGLTTGFVFVDAGPSIPHAKL